MKKITFAGISLRSAVFILAAAFLFAVDARAANTQDWWKKIGQQKGRRIKSRQTSVAAVRGVEEPSDVDPKARDFDGVKKMESRIVPAAKVNQFISEGNLKREGR